MNPTELVELSKVRHLVASGAAESVRVAAGLGLNEMARAIGVAPATLSRWEGRTRTPRGEAALRYGRLLSELMARRNGR